MLRHKTRKILCSEIVLLKTTTYNCGKIQRSIVDALLIYQKQLSATTLFRKIRDKLPEKNRISLFNKTIRSLEQRGIIGVYL